ncbi:unnamed protein product [Acanthosepion pharaonis]|uniref:Nuclear receptor domain-containing protein n=1 Tax=Acanthosepion pharaonis TaxID=158019 RepID=A0A812CS51_ACAPH|nr:unnamed protein product [Sepia pharaonis]
MDTRSPPTNKRKRGRNLGAEDARQKDNDEAFGSSQLCEVCGEVSSEGWSFLPKKAQNAEDDYQNNDSGRKDRSPQCVSVCRTCQEFYQRSVQSKSHLFYICTNNRDAAKVRRKSRTSHRNLNLNSSNVGLGRERGSCPLNTAKQQQHQLREQPEKIPSSSPQSANPDISFKNKNNSLAQKSSKEMNPSVSGNNGETKKPGTILQSEGKRNQPEKNQVAFPGINTQKTQTFTTTTSHSVGQLHPHAKPRHVSSVEVGEKGSVVIKGPQQPPSQQKKGSFLVQKQQQKSFSSQHNNGKGTSKNLTNENSNKPKTTSKDLATRKCAELKSKGPIMVSVSECVCQVCGDSASTFHYGVLTCPDCMLFFQLSNKDDFSEGYSCKQKRHEVTKKNRGRCEYCWYKKCIHMGMSMDKPEVGETVRCIKTEPRPQQQQVTAHRAKDLAVNAKMPGQWYVWLIITATAATKKADLTTSSFAKEGFDQ